jgi:hypothetical protein
METNKKDDEKRYNEALALADKLVTDCMDDPKSWQGNPVVTLAAWYKHDHQPSHQCYWNNRFCIAVMCGLSWYIQRIAAWCAVSNALNGYWEWETHSGYDVAATLKYLGIVEEKFEVAPAYTKSNYAHIDMDLLIKIAKFFNLPTVVISHHKENVLSADEEREREFFNSRYPHKKVL